MNIAVFAILAAPHILQFSIGLTANVFMNKENNQNERPPSERAGDQPSQTPAIRNARHPGIALILQGGGARAAYQVGVLKALSEILGHPKENPFPIITGTSAGAINAALLATHADNFAEGVASLVDVWTKFSPHHVYRTDLPGVLRNSSKWLSAFLFGAFKKSDKKNYIF